MAHSIFVKVLKASFLISVMSFYTCAFAEQPALHYRTDAPDILIPAEVILNKKHEITAPIGDYYMCPIVKVMINNQGPFYFKISTADRETLITENLAKKLKLPIAKTQTIGNDAQGETINTYMANEINVGGVILKNYGIVGSDSLEELVKRGKISHMDGVISLQAFYGYLVTVDYKAEKLIVEKSSLSEDKNNIAYSKGFSIPVIPGKINFSKLKKEITQDFVLSTTYHPKFYIDACKIPEMLKFKNIQGLGVEDERGNATVDYFSQLHGDLIFSESLNFQSPYVFFGQLNCNAPDTTGALGSNFFEKYKVTFDQKNGLVRILKN